MRRQSLWPQWHIKHGYIWLAALSLWLGAAFINGYFYIGGISHWALFNKLTGWFVLLAYFLLGGWLVSNNSARIFSVFTAGFCGAFAFIYFGGFLIILLYSFGFWDAFRPFPYEGLMGNRNAYALILICAVTYLLVISWRMPEFLPSSVMPLILVLLPLMLGYNSSRAAWIAFALMAVYFMAVDWRRFSRKILPWLLCGVVIAGLFFTFIDQHVSKRHHIERLGAAVTILQDQGNVALENVSREDKVRKYASELVRLRNARDSFMLWREAPLIGAGLGAILHYQHQNYDGEKVFIDIMDSTPIWLLAETGLAGFGLFLGFYIMVLRALWQKRKEGEGIEAAFAEALFIFLLAFGVMSLFHEILYTRYLWLMMGMGVAISRSRTNSMETA